MTRTPTDLQAWIEQHNIQAKILHLDTPTPTVESAAQAVGAHPDQIVKSVLFLTPQQPVLAIAYGTAHIDRRAIATRYGLGNKRVKLADARTVLELTGYPAGAVPPFGHPRELPTLLDPGVLRYPQVYAGGGAINALVQVDPREIVRAAKAEILPLLAPAR